jgi:thiamine-phosphate pyrophosphorylase
VIPKLHVVTDDEILGRRDFVPLAQEVLQEGRREIVLHLRGPRSTGRQLFSLSRALLPAARAAGALLLANDRVDVALALNLDGVHLGQRSLPAEVARGLMGDEGTLGLSVHEAGEMEGVEAGNLDFLIVGTIFPTASHPGRAPGGAGRVREIVEATDLPILAIGGITPPRVREVLSAGAFGVAARGGIWDAEDPIAAVRGYLSEMDSI